MHCGWPIYNTTVAGSTIASPIYSLPLREEFLMLDVTLTILNSSVKQKCLKYYVKHM